MAKSLSERIDDGIGLVKSAVSNGDIKLLRECLGHFITLSVPIEKVYEAIKDCPVAMLEEAGFCLAIRSESLGKDLILGQDIPWDEVSTLLSENITGEALKTVLETREIFGGEGCCKG
jgi:hypothetical protein